MTIDWTNYVDHIYVITCTKNKNRIPDLYAELSRVNINVYDNKFVSIVQNINTPLYEALKQHFTSYDPFIHNNNGLFISTIMHYYCMKNALENEYSKVLILEDDIRFLKDKNQIKDILDNSINLFNNIDKQILCCSSTIYTEKFNNTEDVSLTYNDPYLLVNHQIYYIRSSAGNIYNVCSMKYFCDFIESFRIEPSDAYEFIYDNTVNIYITTKPICIQQDWIKFIYNTCKDYNMIRPSEKELDEIRHMNHEYNKDTEAIYQSIIKYTN